jgi:probable selenium-dependent hydroxylase accessory protein YqeC
MTELLSKQLGLGSHELVSIVGAGGKTTILHTLGQELAGAGNKVILTTTTKMAPNQVTGMTCWSSDPDRIEETLAPGVAVFVCTEVTAHKVKGLSPQTVDTLFSSTSADHIIVEADGARSKLIKAPDHHEPVIPGGSTSVVVVVGAGALGRPVGEVAHRIDRITDLTGLTEDDVLTPSHVARILLHSDGGLKAIPEHARVVMAIANVSPDSAIAVTDLASILTAHAAVTRCIILPASSL